MGKWKELAGIHTCHAECQNPACVAVREAYEAGRKDENEACAEVCDEQDHDGVMIAKDCAAAIRARREQ